MTKTIPLQQGYYYHIYNRGNNKEILFRSRTDFIYFLSLFKKYIIPEFDVYAYCLLNNHFHFMIRVREKATNKQPQQYFANLFNAYTKMFNKKYNRTGRLFEERFKRKVIDSDDYLNRIIYYIHANPQAHKLLVDYRDYPFSSYQTILSSKPSGLKREEILKWFGGKEFFKEYHLEMERSLIDESELDDFRLDLAGTREV